MYISERAVATMLIFLESTRSNNGEHAERYKEDQKQFATRTTSNPWKEGAKGKSTSGISTQDAEAAVFERRMRKPYLMKLRHRSPWQWVHCCTCTYKSIIDCHCVILSVSLISWINSSFCMLYWSIKASTAGLLPRLFGRWLGLAGCQVNQLTEKTQNRFGLVWCIEPLTILQQDWETSQVYINALQMPSDLEAVGSTGFQ